MDRLPDPCMMVIFGASGDLTRRKLIPALLDIHRQGLLPSTFTVLGVARTSMTHDGFREYLRQAIADVEALPLKDATKRKWLHDNAARLLRLT